MIKKRSQAYTYDRKSSDHSLIASENQIADKNACQNPIEKILQVHYMNIVGNYFSKNNQKVVEEPDHSPCRHRLQKKDGFLTDHMADCHLFKQPSKQRVSLFSVSSF